MFGGLGTPRLSRLCTSINCVSVGWGAICSLGGLLSEFSLAVSESDVELLCALDEGLAGLGGESLSKFTSVGSVVHEQQFHVGLISDQQFLEAAGEQMSRLLVLLSSDLGSSNFASEAATDARVHTTGRSPRCLSQSPDTLLLDTPNLKHN